jgi:hypothetical protein
MVSRIDNPDLRESRRGPRRRVLKHVQVLSLDKKAASAVDCTLRNISSFGAQLSWPAPIAIRIPSEFYLVAPGQLRMVRCKVVWKSHNRAGISFLSDPSHLISGEAESTSDQPDGCGDRETPEVLSAPESYVLDRTSGAVVRFDDLVSGNISPTAAIPSPEKGSKLGKLERTMSESLSLKVEIAGTDAERRVIVHVQTDGQLNEVCRRLSRQD